MLKSVDYQHIIFSVVLPTRKNNYLNLFSFFMIHNIFTYLKVSQMTRTHIHKNKDEEEEKRKSRDGWIRRLFVHHPSILPFLLLITLNQSSLILLLSFVNS